VNNAARGGPARVDGHAKCVGGQVGRLGTGDRPADDAAAEHVEHDAAVELAFPGGVLGGDANEFAI
jgi:hypothetical protein